VSADRRLALTWAASTVTPLDTWAGPFCIVGVHRDYECTLRRRHKPGGDMALYSAFAIPCACLTLGLPHNESAAHRYQSAVPDSLVLTSAIVSDSSVRVIIPGFSATANTYELRSQWRRISADTLELSSPVVLVPLADSLQLSLLAPVGSPNLSVAFSFQTRSGQQARCTEVGRTFEINLSKPVPGSRVAAVHGLRTCRIG